MPPMPNNAKSAVFFDLGSGNGTEERVFYELEKTVSACGSSPAWSWVASKKKDLDRFKNFRHILPETVNNIIAERKRTIPELHKLGTDFAVPDQYLKEMWEFYQATLDSAGLEWLAFGHIGNNHIHLNIMPGSQQEMQVGLSIYEKFAKKAVQLGGTIAAEHGIGKIKKKFLRIMFSDKELSEMKALKLAFDPELMINPGNMLDFQ
jgi:D-lactate dehydrogenase (cytochrome)